MKTRVPTKDVPLTQDNLEARMARHVEGQITWPAPGEMRRCTSCRFYAVTKPQKVGRCSLVKSHTKKIGKAFDGQNAFACSKLEIRQ